MKNNVFNSYTPQYRWNNTDQYWVYFSICLKMKHNIVGNANFVTLLVYILLQKVKKCNIRAGQVFKNLILGSS